MELAKATLVSGTGRAAAEPAGGLRHRVALYLGGDTSYRLELEDAQGLGNGGGAEYRPPPRLHEHTGGIVERPHEEPGQAS